MVSPRLHRPDEIGEPLAGLVRVAAHERLGLAAVAVGAGVARCRAAQESELRVDPRAGVADGEMKPQRGALRETELPVEPLGNQAPRLFAGELQLHRVRQAVKRLLRTIAPPGKRAGSCGPCTEAPS